MNQLKPIFHIAFSLCLVSTTVTGSVNTAEQSSSQAQVPTQAAQQTAAQLQQLVAPIALYPDALVAQILAAATYPDEVVQADRWLQQQGGVSGDQLAQAVDKQSWDPSVKALVEFPAVLANMDKNLSWTSSLGDAYINQQQDVMDAVQVMRQRAKQAGNLKPTSQLNVKQQDHAIVIEPANPEVVYVPQFDPWMVYGPPIAPWPGWYGYPGLFLSGPGIGFGVGFGIGFFSGFGWGFHHWDSDWHHRGVELDHHTFISHSRTIVNRNYYINRARGNVNRGVSVGRANAFRGESPGGIGRFHGGGGSHSGGGRR